MHPRCTCSNRASRPPMIGPSGSNGESLPNETMNPLFLFELIHTTVVPALMQNNWLLSALGILGFTLAESAPLLMSIVHCDEAEPHVLAALHMFSGCVSPHAYLPRVWDCAVAQVNRRTQDNNGTVLQMLKCSRVFIVLSAYSARVRSLRFVRHLILRLSSCSRATLALRAFNPTRGC
jgi:hypothetical protein